MDKKVIIQLYKAFMVKRINMKENKLTEENINIFTRNFYNKVKVNSDLKEIFEQAIGKNNTDWDNHIKKISVFWRSSMLGTKEYKGNPMKKHVELPKFDIKLFDVWIQLFTDSLNEIYEQQIIDIYLKKVNNIARSFKLVLYNKT